MNKPFRFLIGFALILFSYLIGELAVRMLEIRCPGALAGLLFLLVYQFIFKRSSLCLIEGGRPLLLHMSVLFVPAVMGIGTYWEVINQNLVSISVAIVVATVVSLGITGYVAQIIMRKLVSERDT